MHVSHSAVNKPTVEIKWSTKKYSIIQPKEGRKNFKKKQTKLIQRENKEQDGRLKSNYTEIY